jgi:hypothetical protein
MHTRTCMFVCVCVCVCVCACVCVCVRACNIYGTPRYREELEPALKGISFETSAGEKIGIVGRTAAISQKSLCIVISHSNYSRALTFENFRRGRERQR